MSTGLFIRVSSGAGWTGDLARLKGEFAGCNPGNVEGHCRICRVAPTRITQRTPATGSFLIWTLLHLMQNMGCGMIAILVLSPPLLLPPFLSPRSSALRATAGKGGKGIGRSWKRAVGRGDAGNERSVIKIDIAP